MKEALKMLREMTGAGVLDCKRALDENQGNLEKAIEFLRRKGFEAVKKRAGRATRQGQVGAYIHLGGRIGVLIEVNCETDFVACCDEFQQFVKDLAMQVAARAPRYVSLEEVPHQVLEAERARIRKALVLEGNASESSPERIERELEKWKEEFCLLEQKFIRDENRRIKEYLAELIAKTGENIRIKRFARFELGES